MQAIDIKRFRVTRIGIALAAIGVLSAGIVGLEALDDLTSDSGARAISPNIGQVSAAEDMRYQELKTEWPDASPALARTSEEILFLEMNTLLPGETAPRVLSSDEMLFLEMNTHLPGDNSLPSPKPRQSPLVGGGADTGL